MTGHRPDALTLVEHLRQTIDDELLEHPDVEGYAAEDELTDAIDSLDAAYDDLARARNNDDD